MFGRLDNLITPPVIVAAFLALALADEALGKAWELESEQGVGGRSGGASTKQAAKPSQPNKDSKKSGVKIIVHTDDEPVIREAEGEPVSPFADETPPRDQVAAAAARAEAEAAAAALQMLATKPPDTAKAEAVVADIRAHPPTAAELLQGPAPKPIETEALVALPKPNQAPRLATRPSDATPSASTDVKRTPIEQAQFSPNTAGKPKDALPPRRIEAPAVLPSPRKPAPPKALVQQAVLAPNLGAAPKEPVLRTAPAPDNALIERVEPPSDYSLVLEAGTGELLNLGKAVTNVFVADPNVADVDVASPTQIFVHGNNLGQTNIYGIGDGGDVVFAIDVDTVPNAGAAERQVKAVAPGTAIKVSQRSGTLSADGAVTDVGEAINVAAVAQQLGETQGLTVNNTIIQCSQQVNIRVRFAEVSRNDVFNLGINWDALVDADDFLFGLSTGNFLAAGSDFLARDLAVNGDEYGRVDFTGEFGDVSIDAFLDALQREGVINVLAEPNLTSVNGEPANFLAGGEIPILVPGGGGGDTVTIDYKPFGVSLDFIPTILPGERINLRVRPEVSSISQAGAVVLDGFSVPAFTVRRAETSVELASGQTFAIAGLFQRDLATDTDKFPVLGDVLVLGQLFQSQRFKRYETELVILITPYLVQPTSNRSIALPNNRLDDPTNPLARRDKKRAGFIVN